MMLLEVDLRQFRLRNRSKIKAKQVRLRISALSNFLYALNKRRERASERERCANSTGSNQEHKLYNGLLVSPKHTCFAKLMQSLTVNFLSISLSLSLVSRLVFSIALSSNQ